MRRAPLRPLRYVQFALQTLVHQPLVIALFALSGALTTLALLWSGAQPGTSNWGMGILTSWALALLVLPWANQAAACELWSQTHPEDRPSIHHQLRGGYDALMPYLRSLLLVGLLAPLGLLAFGVGMIAVVVLGFWRCMIISLGLASGRQATDWSWQLAGPGGLLWGVASLLIGFIVAAGVVVLLHGALGAAASLLVAPIVLMVGNLLIAAAALDRIAQSAD